MNHTEFHLHYFDNLEIAIIFLLVSYIVTFAIVRKQIYSVFDPLFFNFLLGAAGYSVVFYLYYFQLIEEYYFYSFIFSQIAFFIGLTFFKLPKTKSLDNEQSLYLARGITGYLYLISFFLFFILQMIVYYYNGFPVFMDSRLEIFSGGSGFGVIGRIIYVTSTISLVIASYSLIFKDSMGLPRVLHKLVFVFYIFVAIVSGSKGALLVMIFILSLMLYFARRKFSSNQIEKKANRILLFILLLVIPVAIFTIISQTGFDNYLEALLAIAMRFVHTGQIFYMTYPNEILLNFPEANGFVALFRDIFGALRMISWNELPINHGLLTFQYHYPTVDILTGPNDRHNTFGLFYFGFFGSIIFSFLMGYIMSFIRNFLYKYLKFNLINISLYVLLVMAANNLNQDPSGMSIGYFFSIALVFTPLFLISYILFQVSRKGKKIEKNTLHTRSI